VDKNGLAIADTDTVTPNAIFLVESGPSSIYLKSAYNNNYVCAQDDGTMRANILQPSDPNHTFICFTPDCICPDQGEFVLMICRVILGDIHICKNYVGKQYRGTAKQPIRKPPLKENNQKIYYDSILGESIENGGDTLKLREFVVYDRAQVYPEYFVTFRRVG